MTQLTDPGALLANDPGSAFLASGDPERFLRDNLPSTDTDRPDSPDHHAQLKAAVAIAAAFMLWRMYAAHQLRKMPPPVEPRGLLLTFWTEHVPVWMRLAVPAVTEAYTYLPMTQQELEAIAVDYAAKMGDYVHQTSSEALVQGYHQELRAGVSPTLAWLRAVEAYGLDEKRMRSWLRTVAGDKAVVPGDLISPGARRALDRAMLLRADVLGDTEAWHARHVGKSILWMYQQQRGELPAGSTKRWLTADDEKVCAICGPLHRHLEPLNQPFLLPDGRELWAPGVHPNCRCELELVVPLYVEKRAPLSKAEPGDPYDRDQRGRFARQESRRRAKPPLPARPVKEREVIPEVQALLEQPEPEPEAPVNVFEPPGEHINVFTPPGAVNVFGENKTPVNVFDTPINLFPDKTEYVNVFAPPPINVFVPPRRKRIVVFGPKPSPIDITPPAPPIGPEPPGTRVGEVALAGDEFLTTDRIRALHDALISGHEAPEGMLFQVGQPIDFTEAARKYWGPGVHNPGMHGVMISDRFTFGNMLEDLAQRYGTAGFPESGQYNAQAVSAARAEALDYITQNPYRMSNDLDAEQIRGLYYDTAQYGPEVRTMSADDLRRDYAERLRDAADPVTEATLQLILGDEDTQPVAYANAIDEVQHTLGNSYLRTPPIFTFPEGHVGGYVDDAKAIPRIMGNYTVKAIIPHELGGNAPSDRIKNWLEIQMVPVEENPDLPHDRHPEVE